MASASLFGDRLNAKTLGVPFQIFASVAASRQSAANRAGVCEMAAFCRKPLHHEIVRRAGVFAQAGYAKLEIGRGDDANGFNMSAICPTISGLKFLS